VVELSFCEEDVTKKNKRGKLCVHYHPHFYTNIRTNKQTHHETNKQTRNKHKQPSSTHTVKLVFSSGALRLTLVHSFLQTFLCSLLLFYQLNTPSGSNKQRRVGLAEFRNSLEHGGEWVPPRVPPISGRDAWFSTWDVTCVFSR
jgi:hypothetical protein